MTQEMIDELYAELGKLVGLCRERKYHAKIRWNGYSRTEPFPLGSILVSDRGIMGYRNGNDKESAHVFVAGLNYGRILDEYPPLNPGRVLEELRTHISRAEMALKRDPQPVCQSDI